MERRIDLTNACYLHLAAKGAPTYDLRVFDDAQASAVWNDYRDHFGFGGSAMKPRCGNITDQHGRIVARVSYNGRVWIDGKPTDGMNAAEWIAQRAKVSA